jgi:hypothetical protein
MSVVLRKKVYATAVSITALAILAASAAGAMGATRSQDRVLTRAWASEIISPSSGQTVLGRSVRVIVRTGPAVHSFRASLGSTRVTGFRGDDRDTSRAITLSPGSSPGLHFGRNTLDVRTADRRGHRWLTRVSFVLARRVPGVITAAAAEPTCGTGARVSADLGRATPSLGLWVNDGRRRAVRGGAQRQINLSADEGLRPGKNTVLLRAVDARTGTYSERQLTVMMPTNLPVAGAGANQRTQAGNLARFSAAATVAPQSNTRLQYRWTVVTRPRGSRARLRGATAVRPSLRPDRPGRYTLQVAVSGTTTPTGPRAGMGGANLLCSARSASDTTNMSATVASSAIGVPIDTIATGTTQFGQQDGVQVGDPGTPGSQFYAEPNEAGDLQMVVLDRATLALVFNDDFPNNEGGSAALAAAISHFSSADLVILTRPDSQKTNDDADVTAANSINQALSMIGAGPLPASVTTGTGCQSGQCSAFSAIGIPGLPAGQADVNSGLAPLASSPAPSGDLHGYLREDLTGTHYTFIDDERVPIDTGDPDDNPAVVTIGSNEPGSGLPSRQYTSQSLSGPGFYVLVLDAGSLKLKQQATFSESASGLGQMHDLLNAASDDPSALVIVRSIGAVGPPPDDAGGPWDAVSLDLRALGGSQYYFEALDGKTSSSFAQVGPTGTAGYPSPWTQIATQQHSGSGRITALLARNGTARFYPDEPESIELANSSRPLAGTLPGLISLPDSAWPDRSTQGDQNVLNCIAAHVNPLGPLRTPIESNYTNQNLADGQSWTTWDATIKEQGYYQTLSSFTDCGAFTQSDFSEVEAQLNREWTAVPLVWGLISHLQSAFANDQGSGDSIQQIASRIAEDIASSSQPVSYDGNAIAGDLFAIFSTLPGASEYANVINFMAGGLALSSDLAKNRDGSDALATIRTTAADLATSLNTKTTDAINDLSNQGDLLVSDWTKLGAAAQNAQNLPNAAADWSWNTQTASNATKQLRRSTAQLAYQTLFPAVYKLYRVEAGTSTLNPTDITAYTCTTFQTTSYTFATTWKPFVGVAVQGSLAPVTFGESRQPWVYATTNHDFLAYPTAKGQFPNQKLLADMFTNPPTDSPDDAPLFNPLRFALEAYGDAQSSNVTYVTHTTYKVQPQSTNNFCTITNP